MVSPRAAPRPARPRASASTRSRRSAQVSDTASSSVRTATMLGWAAAVRRSASPSVAASTAAGVMSRATVLPSICVSSASSVRLASQPDDTGAAQRDSAHSEAAVLQAADVVRQADHEQHDHEREADHARALHDREGDRLPAHLLRERPEDVAAVERQKREQVDDRQRQRDQREDLQRTLGAEADRLARDLVGADEAADLLA